jgi:hypothetical protein
VQLVLQQKHTATRQTRASVESVLHVVQGLVLIQIVLNRIKLCALPVNFTLLTVVSMIRVNVKYVLPVQLVKGPQQRAQRQVTQCVLTAMKAVLIAMWTIRAVVKRVQRVLRAKELAQLVYHQLILFVCHV